MEVVRYEYEAFLACKARAVCNAAVQERLKTLFSNIPCFKVYPGPAMSRHMIDRRPGPSHRGYPRRGRNNNGRRNDHPAPPPKPSDPQKTLHGLLNKMSASNASKITAQILAMTAPSADVIARDILTQACRHDIYVKQYVATLQALLQRSQDTLAVSQVLLDYIEEFHVTPFFIVETAASENYDEFCSRVLTKKNSMGKLKIVLELLLTLPSYVSPYTCAAFLTWYIECWDHVLATDSQSRVMCAELFLDGLLYILGAYKAPVTIAIADFVGYLARVVVDLEMPAKLKFKIMDIQEML